MSGIFSEKTPKHNIKLVVTDVDGTLLSPDGTLSDKVVSAVADLKEHNIHIALCSARPPQSLQKIMQKLNLEGPSAAFNGGILLLADGTIKQNIAIAPKDVQLITNILSSEPVETWLQNDKGWYVHNKETPLVEQEAKRTSLTPIQLENLMDYKGHVNRIIAMGIDPNIVGNMEKWLQQGWGNIVSIARSMPCRINITALKANKGEVILSLAQQYGIDPLHIAALGDASNDIPMLRKAGLAIAMGQAPENVKRVAEFVTGSNAVDGWADAIKKYILNGY